MRYGSIAATLAAIVLAGTACGLGGGISPTTTMSTSSTSTAPPTTLGLPETSTTECEDVPVASDYPVGKRPRAFRPCTLPTALAVHVIRPGTGRAAQDGDTVLADFAGIRASTGEPFDTTYLRGFPYQFVLGRAGDALAGWNTGLTGAQAGALIKLDIPPDLAYGNAPPGDIVQPGDTVTFVIEVRAVLAPVDPAAAPLDKLVGSVGATELGITDLVAGDGATVMASDTALVHTVLARGDDGTVIVNTWEDGDPLQVVVAPDQRLPGLVAGVEGARVGSVRVLTMPPDLAFGAEGNPALGLPPGVDVVAVVEIVGTFPTAFAIDGP